MWSATAWDDSDWDGNQARGWTVMRTLRGRQLAAAPKHVASATREELEVITYGHMRAAGKRQEYENAIKSRMQSGPMVLAFLFAQPDSDAVRTLDTRGKYFDIRTGDTWDLFF